MRHLVLKFVCYHSMENGRMNLFQYHIWMFVFLFGFLKPWLLCWSCMKILKGICCVLSTLSPFEVFVVIVICLYDFNVLQAMQRCSQPIPCSTFNNDGSIFAYAVCSICCFLKPYLFTYAVLYFLLHFLWHSSINKETYICWCIRSAWDAFFASIIEVTSSLARSHSMLCACMTNIIQTRTAMSQL